jgi:iron complex outermembrane receptor protein
MVGGNFNFFDVDRIEILRGPQGTLYGKNTPAGAINVWSKRPSPEFGGYLRGTYGSYDRTDAEGGVSFPLVGEQLSGRIAFLSRNDEGYLDNHAALGVTGPGVSGRVGDQNGKGARLSLLWDPSEPIEMLLLGYRYQENRHGGFPHQVSYVNPALITPPAVVDPTAFDTAGWAAYAAAADEDDIFTTFRGRQDLDTLGASFTASYDLGAAELKYLAGYREYQFLYATDLDGSPFSLADIGREGNPQDEKSRQSSHELTVTGSTLGEKLDYVSGLYYFDERSSNNATQYFDTAFGGLGFRTFGDLVSEIRSWAIYAQGSYALTERLDLVLGLRQTKERREATRNTATCTGADCIPNPAAGLPRTAVSDRWDALTWLAGLELQASDELFLYAKASKGYRSGGFNGRANSLAALRLPFDEEFVTSYEIGAKRDWLDHLLRTNLALFYQKYKNRQTTVLSPTAGIGSIIVNAGNADISGGELELWVEPVPALKLGGSLGWNWFRGDQDPPDEPVNDPKLSYSVWGDYEFPPFDFGQLDARLELQYQSRNFSTDTPTPGAPRVVSPAFGVVNSRIGLDVPALHSEFAFVVTNLLDREYWTVGVDFVPSNFGYQTRYYAPGRRFAIELTYRFGADARP